MQGTTAPLNVFISTPLEPEHVERIRSVAADRVRVVHEPDLHPPTRYVADHKGREGFRRNPDQERKWRDHLERADILWDVPPLTPDGPDFQVLAPNVRWIQTTSSGVGQLVKNLGLQDSDVLFTTARGVHAGPLSEFAFMAILAHFKKLAYLQGEQRARRWERYCGDDLPGKTLAVVGAGEVGRRVASVGRFFGMRVVALDAELPPDRAAELGLDQLFPPDGLHDMLAQADVLVLCVPHTPKTEGMVDAAAFAALKDQAMFINIARGQVVDEAALIAALQSGKIAFAALDVAATEPLPANSPLWDMPNVLISPHSASTVSSENAKITEIFCHNLRCYLDGRIDEMRNVLDKARMY